ncbi:MAG: flagellar biosynthetic protein FliR [Caldicoprobacterales bacterium]|nr:flagellar type III secretion system protein FliR [Clostridiales bacterium]
MDILRFQVFLLVLVRMTGLFLMSPVFGRQNIPNYLKWGLSILLTYIVFSNRFLDSQLELGSFLEFAILITREVLIGFTIGFITTIFFSAIWTAGQLIDTQIGFGMVNVIDPQSSIQVPLMGNFKNILALLAFFVLDGHHTLIKIISFSYDIVPIGEGAVTGELVTLLIKFFANSFVLSVKIALPIIAMTFLSEVAFGILVRTVPQMNVFIVGIPIKILIGLIAILIFIPLFINSLKGIYDGMFNDIGKALRGMMLK